MMIEEQLKQAKLACRKMQNIDKYTKMDALDAISKALLENIDYILEVPCEISPPFFSMSATFSMKYILEPKSW